MTVESTETFCAQLSLGLAESLEGTAPSESIVLAVEMPGHWDRDPTKELSAKLEGVKVLAVRRAMTRYAPGRRRAWLAGLTPGARFLERLEFADERELLEHDLASGSPTGAGFRHDRNVFLCCTHSVRDACCARLGLPLHRAVAAHATERTWHSSHLGGHRFAATMAVLPLGLWLGRVPPARAREVVAACDAGRVPPGLLRGRAGLPPAAQAADAHLRRELEIADVDAIELLGIDGDIVRLRAGGGEHALRAVQVATGTERPVSCGAGAKVEDPGRWEVTPLPRPGS